MDSSDRKNIKSLPRFIVHPDAIKENILTIQAADAHKIKNVLRLEAGDDIAALDNEGKIYYCRLKFIDSGLSISDVLYVIEMQSEPKTKLRLVQSLAKGEKLEQILKMCTEVGVSEFYLVHTERCIMQIEPAKREKKRERYSKVVLEAAEQSYRGNTPGLTLDESFKTLINNQDLTRLLFYEGEDAVPLKNVLNDINKDLDILIFIGPEGGYSKAEVELAKKCDAHIVSIGPRILRTETAGLVACSQILYELEN